MEEHRGGSAAGARPQVVVVRGPPANDTRCTLTGARRIRCGSASAPTAPERPASFGHVDRHGSRSGSPAPDAIDRCMNIERAVRRRQRAVAVHRLLRQANRETVSGRPARNARPGRRRTGAAIGGSLPGLDPRIPTITATPRHTSTQPQRTLAAAIRCHHRPIATTPTARRGCRRRGACRRSGPDGRRAPRKRRRVRQPVRGRASAAGRRSATPAASAAALEVQSGHRRPVGPTPAGNLGRLSSFERDGTGGRERPPPTRRPASNAGRSPAKRPPSASIGHPSESAPGARVLSRSPGSGVGPSGARTPLRRPRGPRSGGHALVAELVLQHPADRVAGQVVAELDVARDREVRNPLGHPAAQLLFGELRAVLEHDGDLHVVLAELARHRVHRDVPQRGVAEQRLLHLEARDVLAPAPQRVLLAVDEEDVAVVVDPAEIAGVEPQVAGRLDRRVGPVPVAARTSGSGPWAGTRSRRPRRPPTSTSSSSTMRTSKSWRLGLPAAPGLFGSPASSIETSDASVRP